MKCGRLAAMLLAIGVVGTGEAVAQDEGAQPSEMTAEQIEAIYAARQDSARMRFTEADVEFVTGMISHHAQALVMSDLAPTNDASEPIRILSARIINAQKDEIALMQRWLEDRDQPVPEVHIDGLELTVTIPGHHADHHGGHDMHAGMPGMLTQAQLEELAAARGPEFDRLYLTYMIQHHQGAVTMVDDLFSVDGTGQDEAVFKLASDIQVDQLTEIARMERMLAGEPEPDGSR